MRIRRTLQAIAILVAQAICAISNCAASDQVGISERRTGAYHAEQAGLDNVLRDIARNAHIPIGFAEVHTGGNSKFIKFDFAGGTIAELLDKLISENPDYAWEEATGGVIHVFRRNAVPQLLSVAVAYPGARDKTRQEIWSQLYELPEVSSWMTANHCQQRQFFSGREFEGHNEPMSLDPQTVTLARLLDGVALKSGKNCWEVSQKMSGEECWMTIYLW